MSIIQMNTQNLNQDYDKCFKNDTWCRESIESSLRIIINYPEERICQLIFKEKTTVYFRLMNGICKASQPWSSQRRIWNLPHLESPPQSQKPLWLHPWLGLYPSSFSWRDRFPWRRCLHILSWRTLTLMVLIAGTLAGHPSSSMFIILYYEE